MTPAPDHLRCEVVTYPSIFQSYNRPYVIVSQTVNTDYPSQRIALGISTSQTEKSIPITEDDWEVGRLSKQSYILPRYPTVISERDVSQVVGALSKEVVDDAASALAEDIGVRVV